MQDLENCRHLVANWWWTCWELLFSIGPDAGKPASSYLYRSGPVWLRRCPHKMEKTKRQINQRKYREGVLKLIRAFYSKVGTKCFICDSTLRLVCHRKSFEPHLKIAHLTRPKLEKEKVENYARLCTPCHLGVHWSHKFLGLTWEEIVSKLR